MNISIIIHCQVCHEVQIIHFLKEKCQQQNDVKSSSGFLHHHEFPAVLIKMKKKNTELFWLQLHIYKVTCVTHDIIMLTLTRVNFSATFLHFWELTLYTLYFKSTRLLLIV